MHRPMAVRHKHQVLLMLVLVCLGQCQYGSMTQVGGSTCTGMQMEYEDPALPPGNRSKCSDICGDVLPTVRVRREDCRHFCPGKELDFTTLNGCYRNINI